MIQLLSLALLCSATASVNYFTESSNTIIDDNALGGVIALLTANVVDHAAFNIGIDTTSAITSVVIHICVTTISLLPRFLQHLSF